MNKQTPFAPLSLSAKLIAAQRRTKRPRALNRDCQVDAVMAGLGRLLPNEEKSAEAQREGEEAEPRDTPALMNISLCFSNLNSNPLNKEQGRSWLV